MGTPVPEDLLAETVFFDFAQLAAKAPRILGSKLIPGNCHLTMLAFFGARPGFDYYWHIEYDVVFTGDWRTLLDAWRGMQRPRRGASCERAARSRIGRGGPRCKSLRRGGSGPVRAFLPVYRISRRALERLEMAVREGSSGHFEALVPTVLQAASLRISDLGGRTILHQLYLARWRVAAGHVALSALSRSAAPGPEPSLSSGEAGELPDGAAPPASARPAIGPAMGQKLASRGPSQPALAQA